MLFAAILIALTGVAPPAAAASSPVPEAKSTFRGSPITIEVRDADVRDVLRLIASASGFNLAVSSKVTERITLSLVDVPWDQALDVVLATARLHAERNGNVLSVTTLSDFVAGLAAEAQVRRLSGATAGSSTDVKVIQLKSSQAPAQGN
jgi:type II secretory pathway component HofQ